MNNKAQSPKLKLANLALALIKNRASMRPTILMHAVTEACNARCSYCVFKHGRKAENELELDEMSKLYSDSVDMGIRYVHLWGGEPLAHPKIGNIIQMASDAGLSVGMVSNGKLLNKRLEQLSLLDRLNVSIDYPGTLHDKFRNTPNLFNDAVSGLENFRKKWPNKRLVLSFVLHKENAGSINEMLSLCKHLDARLYINPMRSTSNILSDDATAQGLGKENYDMVIPWEDQLPIWKDILKLKRKGSPIQNSSYYINNILTNSGPPKYRCHWPKISIGIEANGDVVDCQRWDEPLGNIRNNSLKHILSQERSLSLKGKDGESCNDCFSPARVEPSGIWGLNPSIWFQSLKTL